jgi:pimeloyl-ACP methyl ester carboxylesterase
MLKAIGFIAATLFVGSHGPVQRAGTVSSCSFSAGPEPAKCVIVRVPENPASATSRPIEVRAVVLAGRGERPFREPLLVLQGGPGVAGTGMAQNFWRREPLRERRDLVFIDQRGTSGRNILNCESLGRFNFLGALFPPDHIRNCRDRLEKRATLASYTNAASAADLEEIRKALGIDTWSIYAVSFGTRLAQTYAKKYPVRVRSVILDGVVPFDAQLAGDLAESMEQSLVYVAGRCDKDPACGPRYPNTLGTLAQLADRLDSAAVTVRVTDSLGRTLTGKFGKWDLAYAVRGMLYGPLAGAIPAMAHHARRTGNFNEFAMIYWQRSRWVGDSSSVPLHLGVYCAEDLPFHDPAESRRRAKGTFIGDDYFDEYHRACQRWPMPRAVAEMREPWRSSIPTLLLSGERDPVTPPSYGNRVGRTLSQHRHIVLPAGGHAEQSVCKTGVLAQFLNGGLASVSSRTCLESDQFPPWR